VKKKEKKEGKELGKEMGKKEAGGSSVTRESEEGGRRRVKSWRRRWGRRRLEEAV
jgi:hypothetical protein